MKIPFDSVTSVTPDEFMAPLVGGHRAREPRLVLSWASTVAPCRPLEMVQVEGALSAVLGLKPSRQPAPCFICLLIM